MNPSKKKPIQRGRSVLPSNNQSNQVPIHSNKSQSVLSNPKYRICNYVNLTLKEEAGTKFMIESEGIQLHCRGASKGIHYFECSSSRLRNSPDCHFRGRIPNLNKLLEEGAIEIIEDHSKTCKFILGNQSVDFNKNQTLKPDKRMYKSMVLEIEKKLEDQNWLTPAEVLKWIKSSYTIEKHLDYTQVHDIVKNWREKNSANKDTYIFKNNLNKNGLPFLRYFMVKSYKKIKTNINKMLKIIIWASDFQVNRLRLTNHWYIDGTFTVVPVGYHQLITLAIRDPNTGLIKPALWVLLDSKDEEAYFHAFQEIKNVVSASDTLQWNLSSITIDFEVGLLNAMGQVFPNTRLVGCLFHFKQALYRETQCLGLTTQELKEECQLLVSRLGSLSWKDNLKNIEQELDFIKKRYESTKYMNLLQYYLKNWLPRLKSGLIDYSNLEDTFRANSVLEQYNSHVKDSLPRNPSWPKFVGFLAEEEGNYVNEVFMAEQRGQINVKSVNFGQTYLPKVLKKKINVESPKIKSNNQDGSQKLMTKNKRNPPIKRKASDSPLETNKFLKPDLKKQKKTGDGLLKDKESKPTKTYKKSDKTTNLPIQIVQIKHTKDHVKKSYKNALGHNWIEWQNNSCRYDSFMTIFALKLFPLFSNFCAYQADKRNKFYETYILLVKTTENLINHSINSNRQNQILEFWNNMFQTGIDENKPGEYGYVTSLLCLLTPLLKLRPFVSEKTKCQKCTIEYSNRFRWNLPIQIQDINDLKLNSIQSYFDWYLGKKKQECEICKEKAKEIIWSYQDEPNFIILEYINAKKRDNFKFNELIESKLTHSRFELIATINTPFLNHFNCTINEPILAGEKSTLKGWWIHDGTLNQGRITPLAGIQQVWNEKPLIFVYKKINFIHEINI